MVAGLRGWIGCGVLAFTAAGVSQVSPAPTVAAPAAVPVPAVDTSAPLNEARRLLANDDYAGADAALRTLLVVPEVVLAAARWSSPRLRARRWMP